MNQLGFSDLIQKIIDSRVVTEDDTDIINLLSGIREPEKTSEEFANLRELLGYNSK